MVFRSRFIDMALLVCVGLLWSAPAPADQALKGAVPPSRVATIELVDLGTGAVEKMVVDDPASFRIEELYALLKERGYANYLIAPQSTGYKVLVLGVGDPRLRSNPTIKRARQPDLMDQEVIPSPDGRKPGLTLREFLERQAALAEKGQTQPTSIDPEGRVSFDAFARTVEEQGKKRDLEKAQVVPPGGAEGPGMTVKDFLASVDKKNQAPVGDLEIVPPSRPGEKGLTARDVARKAEAAGKQ